MGEHTTLSGQGGPQCLSVMSVLGTVVNVLLLPVYITVMVLFLVVWALFTLTGIGPLGQYICNLRDRRTLDRDAIAETNSAIRVLRVPGTVHSCSEGKPYSVFAIFTEPVGGPSKYPPVCIPNGLGATAVLIAQMQERLTELGFTVLSFDRLGVGLSDANASGQSPTAIDLVQEMNFLMEFFQPKDTKWVLLGPSMGSIVAQCYISQFPDKIVGFLNMDGLPYPFIQFQRAFMWAGFIYRVYSSITWTGVLRPFVGMALQANEKMFQSKLFPLKIAIAQMNQSRFLANVGTEMWTMMDCCEMAELAWGGVSTLHLPPEHLENLVRAPPTVSIEFDERTNERLVTTERSPSEPGAAWASIESVGATERFLRTCGQVDDLEDRVIDRAPKNAEARLQALVGETEKEHARIASADPLLKFDALERLNKSTQSRNALCSSRLGEIWPRLVVRVMSARNHDFGNAVANSFYNQSMRDFAAAEHAKHALLAGNGARTVYPKLTHAVMFSKTDDIVRNIQEIAFALQDSQDR